MGRPELRDRDVTYLDAFPLEGAVRGIHGPFVPPVVWDEHRGFFNPDTGTDYGCWWAVTDTGGVPVPVAVVEEMQDASGTGVAWSVDLTDLTDHATEDQKRAHWIREWDRIRGNLNTAAARVTERRWP